MVPTTMRRSVPKIDVLQQTCHGPNGLTPSSQCLDFQVSENFARQWWVVRAIKLL